LRSWVTVRSVGVVTVAFVAVLFARRAFLPGSQMGDSKITIAKLSESELASSVRGKQVLIVGGTKGIGTGFARSFAKRGANVAISGRSDGQPVVDELKKLGPSGRHEFLKADVSLAKSSSSFAKAFIAAHPKLDYLIVTVGIIADSTLTLTDEGLERAFAVSFFGSRFVLINEMMDYLKKSNTRVVLLGMYGHSSKVDLDDMQSIKNYGAMKAHGNTHAANEMFIQQLAKRFPEVEVFGFSPGVVHSDAYNAWLGDTWKGWIADKLIGLFGKSVDDYTENMIHTIATDKLKGKSGLYFDNSGTTQQISQWLTEGDISDQYYNLCLGVQKDVLSKK
jgi:NAD(P)-dependent dehydrogenase (short-subunit alcohol dehydrogenase family)